MPVGRPPKATHLHILDGTYRADRHGDAHANQPQLETVKRLPRAPEFLGKIGRREWNRIGPELVEKGVLTAADMASFAGYCASLERAIRAEEMIRDEGYTLETPQGFEQARPEVSIARQAWAEVRKFGQEFGITPSSRTRVRPAGGKPPEKKGDDAWDQVMNPQPPAAAETGS